MNRKTLAALVAVLGGAVASAGIALIYVPAALIAAGVGLLAFGLVGVDVDRGGS